MQAIYTLWLRNVKRYLRSKSRIIGSLGMPIFFLVIMGIGINSAFNLQGVGGGNYIDFVAPGIVAMTVLFTSMFSGIQVIWDKQFGFLKETLVAPVPRLHIMIGQTLGGATTAIIQGLLILIISLLIGVKIASIGGFGIALLFMFLTGIGFTAMGIAIASRLDDMQGFQLIMNFVVFPLFFLSGALFPLKGLPVWLDFVTLLDPLTYGVEGIRFGLLGVSQISPLTSLIVLGSFDIAMLIFGGYLFNKIKI